MLVSELVVTIVDDVVRSQPTPPAGTCRDSPSQSARRSLAVVREVHAKSPSRHARGSPGRGGWTLGNHPASVAEDEDVVGPKTPKVVVLVVPDRVVGRVDQEQCKVASARVKAERWGTNGAIQAPLPDWKSSSFILRCQRCTCRKTCVRMGLCTCPSFESAHVLELTWDLFQVQL